MSTLRSNNRLAWLQSFCPTTEMERHVLCRIGKYYHPERITLQTTLGINVNNTVSQLRFLLDIIPDESLLDKLHEDGYCVTDVDGQFYCIDFANRTIINMNA